MLLTTVSAISPEGGSAQSRCLIKAVSYERIAFGTMRNRKTWHSFHMQGVDIFASLEGSHLSNSRWRTSVYFLNSPLTVCRLFRDISSEDGCCGGGPTLFPSPLHFLWWPLISMVGLHGKHSGRISRQISRLPSEPDQPSPASPRSGGRTFFCHPCLFSSYVPKSTGKTAHKGIQSCGPLDLHLKRTHILAFQGWQLEQAP